MTNSVNIIGLALVSALAAGVLAATIGLFGSDGPPPVSAQADTTAPTVSSVAVTGVPRLGLVIGGNRSKTAGYERLSLLPGSRRL